MKQFGLISILSLLILFGCGKGEPDSVFVLLPSSKTGVTFRNDIVETRDFNPIKYIYIYNGAGVGTGDINNDGLPDLFFAGNEVPSRLYLNRGNMKFEDITDTAGILKDGWATGVSFVDINADGLMDIYVCIANTDLTKAENQLYINQGNGRFKEEAKAYGLDDNGYSTQAVFFDYDLDGDLDMYLLTNGIDSFNHNNMRPIKKDGTGISTDRLYRNNGDNTYTNVSKEAGVTIEGYGLGVGIMDVNHDGWPDVYCSNDFITNDLLWINNGDGTFTDRIVDYISQTSRNGMGTDIADYNNDGMHDIVQMDMLPESNLHNKTMTPAMNYNNQTIRFGLDYMAQFVRNTLQLRNADGSFSEIGRMADIHKTDWSWAPLLADYDNDGLKDLFVTNGYGKDITDLDFTTYSDGLNNPFGEDSIREQKAYENMVNLPSIDLPNYFFRNRGNLTFENVTCTWSPAIPSMSNGAVYVDLDGDGDLDLVANNVNGDAFIYENTTMEKSNGKIHFLQVALNGPEKNPGGVGAQVTIYCGDSIQKIDQYPVRGYISSVDYVLHFGLGNRKYVDSLQVVWPDGKSQILRSIPADKRINLSYADSKMRAERTIAPKNTLMANISESTEHIIHKENPYIDFQDQPLLLKMLSREGPGLAVGDVNRDGLDDIFMSTALKDTSYIWIQNKDGSFLKGAAMPQSWNYEQQGCIMADFNNDGRLDLYVASGGNELSLKDGNYQDQFYLQTGEGTFELATDRLPKMMSSTATVNAADFDGDGDLDLFVGSRLMPESYPFPGQSYILENDNGYFKDVTAASAPKLADVGLVTSALWTDFDNDGALDLIVVGEWMEVTFFKNENGKFINATQATGLGGLTGSWNSIMGTDFDGDGDTDYIVGNLGTNTDLKASEKEPLTIVAKDFDENGSIDAVMGYYVNGINYPLPNRDALISQISAMKRRFPYYKVYGNTTFDQVFKMEELDGALRKEIAVLGTVYLENQGNGRFVYRLLPQRAQMAPVYGISVADLDRDGNPDVLLTGNRTDTETLGGYLNGSIGTVLLGDGHSGFHNLEVDKSGFITPGDTRGIAQLISDKGTDFLVANNDNKLQRFRLETSLNTMILDPNDIYALIKMPNGKVFKREFYFGSGYLSQSSRKFQYPKDALSVTVFNSKNGQQDILGTDIAK